MKIKKVLLGGGIAIVLIIAALVIYLYPAFGFLVKTENIQLDENLGVYFGGGGNSGVLVTDSAVVVIDTKMMVNSADVYNAAKERAGKKPIIVINTHYHSDHTNGNTYYTGSKIYIGGYDIDFLKNVMNPDNMPTDFVKDSLVLNLGNETVIMYDLGQAHTTNDMVVYLKNRKILFTGDLVFNKINPVLMKNSGADVEKWITVLDKILIKFDLIKVVPGHGNIGGQEIIIAMEQYFADMKEAATYPDREDVIKAKYSNWQEVPTMSSTGKTIDYIKGGK
jgi:cyclase